MQLELSQKLLNFDDVKGGFEKDRKIGGVICSMKMLKKKMREKNWKYKQMPYMLAMDILKQDWSV